MSLPPLPPPAVPPSELITKSGVWAGLYTADQMIAYGQQCRQQALSAAAEQVRIGQGPRSSAEDAVKSLTGEVNCNRHPDAPHGYNRTASLNAGRYVCECESWSPGEAS